MDFTSHQNDGKSMKPMTIAEHEPMSELRKLLNERRHPRQHQRLRVIVLSRQGNRTPAEIGQQVGVAPGTVAKWIALYNEAGLAALLDL